MIIIDSILIISLILMLSLFIFITPKSEEIEMPNLNTLKEANEYALNHNVEITFKYIENPIIKKDAIINQKPSQGEIIKENIIITLELSSGSFNDVTLKEANINEIGMIPIMMYHGIYDLKNEETKYTGGNVDKDGYNRTAEAFKEDLEMYYREGYEGLKLSDYVSGNINTSFGKSPIVLTFDDGLKSQVNILGLDNSDNIIIDPNCALGILESFKKENPEFNVTAAFFLNDHLFGQSLYNEKILHFLVENNYEVGSHTANHLHLNQVSKETAQKEVAQVYQIFDDIIPEKYLKIVALPYGEPYKSSHSIFTYILKGSYKGYQYETISTLKVGWTTDYSPFDERFNQQFLNRIRAYDNNGIDFDIKYVFNKLKENRYVSDGYAETLITTSIFENRIKENIYDTKIILY